MLYFLTALLLSVFFTLAVRRLAIYFNIVDEAREPRKKHLGKMPLLGGTAVFLSFWLVVIYLLFFTKLLGPNLQTNTLLLVCGAGAILMAVGFLDDKYSLPAMPRFIISAGCVLMVVLGGVGLEKITNPFGGVLYLDTWKINLGFLGARSVWSSVLVFVWILGMMYTTKILDGLDGLSTGISSIAALMIFFIASGARWHQPDVALVSLVFAGACLGFLIFNFHPAKIFLGEGGSLFLGFMLGILSVIAGGKIATALLVMAVPVLDLIRVVVMRLRKGKKIWQGDREHLHFQLVDLGFGQKKIVLIFYFIAFVFGITTLFLQSMQKIFALFFLFLLMIFLGLFLASKQKHS